jgi:hypothetical protein
MANNYGRSLQQTLKPFAPKRNLASPAVASQRALSKRVSLVRAHDDAAPNGWLADRQPYVLCDLSGTCAQA